MSSGWDISAFTSAIVGHFQSELASHAGGVGDAREPDPQQKTKDNYPFHIVYVSGAGDADDRERFFWNAPAMSEVTVQVTTVGWTRAQRDWAERAAFDAAMNATIADWSVNDGRTASVILRRRGNRFADGDADGELPQVAQRFVYTVTVST